MTCRLQTVVQNDLVHIQRCSCGLVHLHFGHFSMRIPDTDVATLAKSLAAAEKAMKPQLVAQKKMNRQRITKKLVFRVE